MSDAPLRCYSEMSKNLTGPAPAATASLLVGLLLGFLGFLLGLLLSLGLLLLSLLVSLAAWNCQFTVSTPYFHHIHQTLASMRQS